MSTHSLLGVLYAEDFDEEDDAALPVAAVPAEPEIIEPSFDAAELDAARAEARAAGRQDAERGLLASRTQMLGAIATGIADARADVVKASEQLAEEVARCMLAALMACLPALCERHGETELRAVVRILLPGLFNEPSVTIRVHPGMLDAVREEIAALDEEAAARITLLASDTLPPGDIRVTWCDGTAIRNAARARTAIHDTLAALGLLEEPANA